MVNIKTIENKTVITIDKNENTMNVLFNIMWFEFIDNNENNETNDKLRFEKHHKDFLSFIEKKFDEMD